MAQIQAEKTVSTAKETQYKFDRIPVVALRNIVAFPNAVIHVDIERKLSVNAVKYAFNEGTDILLVAQKDAAAETVERDNLFDTGVLATVNQIVKTGKDVLRVAFDCKERGRLGEELKESGQTMFAERLPIEENWTNTNPTRRRRYLKRSEPFLTVSAKKIQTSPPRSNSLSERIRISASLRTILRRIIRSGLPKNKRCLTRLIPSSARKYCLNVSSDK
mgnify:CR=1 FL=1